MAQAVHAPASGVLPRVQAGKQVSAEAGLRVSCCLQGGLLAAVCVWC